MVAGSSKKVRWKCDKGEDHEWSTAIHNRTINKTGCPFCSGRYASKTNCLAYNYPEVAAQWHPDKNGDLTPENVVAGSRKKAWWKCDKSEDHEWSTAIHNRTTNKSGCPFCSGRYASKDKNLSVEYPTLAKMWHPTKNEGLTPDNILAGSNSKVWWKCDNGLDHEWKAQPNSMQRSFKTGNSGCPFCRGLEVSVTNKLSILYPEVAKEWHPTKNGSLTPDNVTFGSGQKVWWKCRGMEEHIWQASISDRTVGGRGCPGCNLRGDIKNRDPVKV